MRCLLVDDEPLARTRLRLLLEEAAPDAEVVGEASTGREALALVATLAPDVLFLDVEMPGLSGFDVAELLPPAPRPRLVFVTAYDAYALRAFDVHAVDYLTKPVRAERLRRTLDHLRATAPPSADAQREAALAIRASLAPVAEADAERLPRLTVRAGSRLRVLELDEITRFEAESKLVRVHTPTADTRVPFTTDLTLDALEARLDPAAFVRVHRAHLVRAAMLRELVPWFSGTFKARLRDGAEVPVARRRVREVRHRLGG